MCDRYLFVNGGISPRRTWSHFAITVLPLRLRQGIMVLIDVYCRRVTPPIEAECPFRASLRRNHHARIWSAYRDKADLPSPSVCGRSRSDRISTTLETDTSWRMLRFATHPLHVGDSRARWQQQNAMHQMLRILKARQTRAADAAARRLRANKKSARVNTR